MRSHLLIAATLFLAGINISSARGQVPGISPFDTFQHAEIGPVRLHRDTQSGTSAILFASQMQVNTDGAQDSYNPDNTGITHICNGVNVRAGTKPNGQPIFRWKANCLPEFRRARAVGYSGHQIEFFAMVKDRRTGIPVIQGRGDPFPSYFVATTALTQPGEPADTLRAQLNQSL